MNIFRTIHVGAGVILALFVTGVIALSVVVASGFYKLIVDWWAWWQNPFRK